MSSGGILYAGTDIEGVFRSTDDGSSWEAANIGIEKTSIHSLTTNANYLFAGVDFDYRGHGGVYRTPLDGTQWTPVNVGISAMTIASLYADGANIYAGTIGSGVFKSTDNGESWIQSNNGMGDEFVNSITMNNGILFAAGSNNLYRSDDGGGSWYFTDGGQYFNIFSLFAEGEYMYAGGFAGFIRSTDYGNTWSNRIDIQILTTGAHLTCFAARDTILYATTSTGPGIGVITSSDHGGIWTPLNEGIENVSLNTIVTTPASLIAGGSAKGILLSVDEGATWIKSNEGLPPGGSIRRLLRIKDAVYSGTGGDGVHRTTDNGATWESTSNEPDGVLQNEIVPALAEKGGVLLAGTGYEGVFRSTDGGSSWTRSSGGLPENDIVLSLAGSGEHFIVGTGLGIFYSTDIGETWLPSNVSDATVTDIAAEEGYAYAIVHSGIFTSTGIYRSTDDGINWTLVTESGTTTLVGLTATGPYVLTGSFSPGGFRSTDYGVSWLGYSIPNADGVYSLFSLDETIYAGAGLQSQGVYKSTDFGVSFSPFNAGLEPFTSVEALAANDEFLFAGTNDRAVWTYPLEGTSGVGSEESSVPDEFRLEPNYPNPFNATTLITFHVPTRSFVTIRVFDLLGRLVKTVVSETFEQGIYHCQLVVPDLSSGVYVCHLQAGSRSASMKMILLR